MSSVQKDFIETHKDRMISELFELLRIPSVSADPKYKADVEKTAYAVKASLIKAGADNVEVLPTGGHPMVYGEKIIDLLSQLLLRLQS